jgi:hypothetical protein
MSNRGQPFVVEVRRKPNADYTSRPGDARRSGRAEAPGNAVVSIEFKDIGSQIEARLGVVIVGSVTHDPAAGGYFWAVFLPGMPRSPKPASDADKGKAAIAHKVREWCEAAKLISARRGQ